MHKKQLLRLYSSVVLLLLFLLLGATLAFAQTPGFCNNYPQDPLTGWQSTKVFYSNGKLVYASDSEGNRIPDYSYSGYKYGQVNLPVVPQAQFLSVASGDQTARIQAALDAVGNLPLTNGIRGAVVLGPGTWEIRGTININKSGVVLRGAGDDGTASSNTILRATGNTPAGRNVVRLGSGSNSWTEGLKTNITDAFVQVGARSFNVASTSGFAVGQSVVVHHPSTQAWIEAVDCGGSPTGNCWTAGQQDIVYYRKIAAISGNNVTLDAPVFNHLDKSLSQSYLAAASAGEITESGVEDIRIDIVAATPTDENHATNGLYIQGAHSSWVRNVTALHFVYAGIKIENGVGITIENCRSIDPTGAGGGGQWYNFTNDRRAQLVLYKFCEAMGGRHSFVCNGLTWSSGITYYRCTQEGGGSEGGHRNWTTGILYDNHDEQTSGQVLLINRGNAGSTIQGWSSAHSTIWKYDDEMVVQKPPTAQNYGISNVGSFRQTFYNPGPRGHEELKSGNLVPTSLYEAQLCERLKGSGGGATIAIGTTQAENLDKVNFETNVFETVTCVRATSTAIGSISGKFTGATGTYSLTIRYFDENDGAATFTAKVNGITVGTRTANVNDHTWKDWTINNISIVNNQEIKIESAQEAGEHARIDAIAIAAAANNVDPTVSLTSPANGAVILGGSITISANASDSDGTVTKVEFFNGTTELGEDATTPYSFTWSGFSPGTYTLTAKATDNDGAVTTSAPVTVRVNADPTVSFTINPPPPNPLISPATITINANASDSDGTIGKVEFFFNSVKVGEDMSAPYSFVVSNIPAGSHTIRVTATDNDGATAFSPVMNLVVQNPVPLVSITSPANGTTFTSPATVDITATASDDNGTITKVEFFEGSNKLGEDTSAPYAFTWSNVSAGTYSLTAKATDNEGATGTSIPISITVNSSSTPVVFGPVHDAYVRSGIHGNTTHGTTDAITLITKVAPATQVDNSRETYLKFDLTSVTGTISSAQLRVFGRIEDATATNIPVGIFSVANTTWTESAITWNNKPISTTSALQSAIVTDATGRYYTWDITNYIKSEVAAGRKVISLAMKSGAEHNPRILWSSKETGSNSPQLSVVVSTSAPCDPAIASADDGNVAANVLDNNLATRWSASGDPQWIQFCLASTSSVNGVQIAFYKGNERTSNFDVLVSTDGTNFTPASTGRVSSGTSLALETFSFPAKTAKYVRIVGHGNNLNLWNSYTEVKINTGAASINETEGKDPMSIADGSLVSCYPNPANALVTISYTVKKDGRIKLSLYNASGNQTTVIVDEHLKAGTYKTTFDTKNLSNGLHVIKLMQHGKLSVHKLIKNK